MQVKHEFGICNGYTLHAFFIEQFFHFQHNEEYPEEELKFQERIETVVPPDFDISQLLTQPAEVLLEKLQIEKLGNLTD